MTTSESLTVKNDQDRAYLQTPEQWTSFLSAFAHELRTPLSSLRMLAELLAESPQGNLGAQEKHYTQKLQEVVQDIQGLVGEVAELARLLAGRTQIRPQEVALEQLLDQVKEAVRPRAWEKGIVLTDSPDSALHRVFRTDADRLRQVLTLLLGATVSHAESEVFFRLAFDNGELRIVISSDGLPFPETALQTLFGPFHEVVRSARQTGGRSLALPLANELSRALGGTLRASNKGGRPTFELSVPAAD